MSFHLYARAIEDFVSGAQDWDDDPHYVALLSSGYAHDKINHHSWLHVSAHECTSPEYAAQPLTGETSFIDAEDKVVCDADDVEFGYQSSLQARSLVIVRGIATSKSPTDKLIGFMDFGDLNITNRPLSVHWHVTRGVFRIFQGCDCSHAPALVFVGKSDLLISSNSALAHAGAGAYIQNSGIIISSFAPEVASSVSDAIQPGQLLISSHVPNTVAGLVASPSFSDLVIEAKPVTASSSHNVVPIAGTMLAQYGLFADVRVENLATYEESANTTFSMPTIVLETQISPPTYNESASTVFGSVVTATESLLAPEVWHENMTTSVGLISSPNELLAGGITAEPAIVSVISPKDPNSYTFDIPNAAPYNTPGYRVAFFIYRPYSPFTVLPYVGALAMSGWTKAVSRPGVDVDELAIFYRDTPFSGPQTLTGVLGGHDFAAGLGFWSLTDWSGTPVSPTFGQASALRTDGGSISPSVTTQWLPTGVYCVWAGSSQSPFFNYQGISGGQAPDFQVTGFAHQQWANMIIARRNVAIHPNGLGGTSMGVGGVTLTKTTGHNHPPAWCTATIAMYNIRNG